MAREEDQEFQHESYGLIGIHHINSRGAILFGSSIKHSEVIRIEIAHGKMYRGLSYDRYHAGNRIVEVDLSYSQFAEFITTHNRGTGIPCTLRQVHGARMEDPPFQNKREQHAQEFKTRTDKIASKLDELYAFAQTLQEKPSVTKKEREELVDRIRYARQCISSDLPFALKQFDEQMDHSVKEAKGEIEGFALRRLLMAGQIALEGEMMKPLLPVLDRADESVDIANTGYVDATVENTGQGDPGILSIDGDL